MGSNEQNYRLGSTIVLKFLNSKKPRTLHSFNWFSERAEKDNSFTHAFWIFLSEVHLKLLQKGTEIPAIALYTDKKQNFLLTNLTFFSSKTEYTDDLLRLNTEHTESSKTDYT